MGIKKYGQIYRPKRWWSLKDRAKAKQKSRSLKDAARLNTIRKAAEQIGLSGNELRLTSIQLFRHTRNKNVDKHTRYAIFEIIKKRKRALKRKNTLRKRLQKAERKLSSTKNAAESPQKTFMGIFRKNLRKEQLKSAQRDLEKKKKMGGKRAKKAQKKADKAVKRAEKKIILSKRQLSEVPGKNIETSNRKLRKAQRKRDLAYSKAKGKSQ
jgi:hypothetical protein